MPTRQGETTYVPLSNKLRIETFAQSTCFLFFPSLAVFVKGFRLLLSSLLGVLGAFLSSFSSFFLTFGHDHPRESV